MFGLQHPYTIWDCFMTMERNLNPSFLHCVVGSYFSITNAIGKTQKLQMQNGRQDAQKTLSHLYFFDPICSISCEQEPRISLIGEKGNLVNSIFLMKTVDIFYIWVFTRGGVKDKNLKQTLRITLAAVQQETRLLNHVIRLGGVEVESDYLPPACRRSL